MDDPRLSSLQTRNSVLEAQNFALQARVDDLERALLGDPGSAAPVEWRLTPTQGRLFRALLARERVSKEGVMTALYYERSDVDRPELKIADVFICKLRAKLAPLEIEIETLWGFGWRLNPADRARLRRDARAPDDEIAERTRA